MTLFGYKVIGKDFFKIKKDLYRKYICITASNSIDCPKVERLRIHNLYNEQNVLDNVNLNIVNIMNPNYDFKPVYEGELRI